MSATKTAHKPRIVSVDSQDFSPALLRVQNRPPAPFAAKPINTGIFGVLDRGSPIGARCGVVGFYKNEFLANAANDARYKTERRVA